MFDGRPMQLYQHSHDHATSSAFILLGGFVREIGDRSKIEGIKRERRVKNSPHAEEQNQPPTPHTQPSYL